MEEGRYYSIQFVDMYTFYFSYVGSRATGNGAGSFLHLAQEIGVDDVCGRIIILPALNFPAIEAGQRVSPLNNAISIACFWVMRQGHQRK